jgi:transposase-like protein
VDALPVNEATHHVIHVTSRILYYMPRFLPEHQRQRQTYSEDLRKRVIYQRFTREKKIDEIALDLNMSKRVVERILNLWRTTGEVMSQEPGKKGKRRKIMTQEEMEASNRPIFHRINLLITPYTSFFFDLQRSSPTYIWMRYREYCSVCMA